MMSCEYARSAGYMQAITKFLDKTNELMDKAIKSSKESSSQHPDYWRAIGRQDILLELMDFLSNSVSEYE